MLKGPLVWGKFPWPNDHVVKKRERQWKNYNGIVSSHQWYGTKSRCVILLQSRSKAVMQTWYVHGTMKRLQPIEAEPSKTGLHRHLQLTGVSQLLPGSTSACRHPVSTLIVNLRKFREVYNLNRSALHNCSIHAIFCLELCPPHCASNNLLPLTWQLWWIFRGVFAWLRCALQCIQLPLSTRSTHAASGSNMLPFPAQILPAPRVFFWDDPSFHSTKTVSIVVSECSRIMSEWMYFFYDQHRPFRTKRFPTYLPYARSSVRDAIFGISSNKYLHCFYISFPCSPSRNGGPSSGAIFHSSEILVLVQNFHHIRHQ